MATVECDLGLEEDQGLLILINYDRTSTLVVSGDLTKAGLVLTNYNFYPLMKKIIIVDGEIGNLVLNYH
ncbi:hypothetical protein HYU23_03255 [Candidatus Woesearchaeota archaeon]|nr:hypothetical protein [Candidatus Woesearchaeota archaeon]